jgi:rare lipoprotein A
MYTTGRNLIACAVTASVGLADAPSALAEHARGVQRGKASWYGAGHHGRRTASGEVFSSNGMTAAHRSLPFGTRLRVTNERTGHSVVVRVNDRGPFGGGRVIDVSRAAAVAIGLAGVAPVVLTRL